MTEPLDEVLTLAERVYVRMQAEQLIRQCLDRGDPRPFNALLENLVLATGKSQAHRIYLGEGVFGDLTLIFRKGTYQPLPWTYPDYASRELIAVLEEVRQRYKCKLTLRGGQPTP